MNLATINKRHGGSYLARILGAITCCGAGAVLSCGGESEPPKTAESTFASHSPQQCGIDEVRRYHCDSLMLRHANVMAPEPYGECPITTERHKRAAEPDVAYFDSSYTQHVRHRMPPGNSCCYSWCEQLQVVEAKGPAAACADQTFREEYCVDEPEAGASAPAASPFGGCPEGIVPPEREAFDVPEVAALDMQLTQQRRQMGYKQCCFAWCADSAGAPGLQ